MHVKEILPQMITLAECYIQIWRLNRKLTRDERENEQQLDFGDTSVPLDQRFAGQSETLRKPESKTAPPPSTITSNFMDTS